MLSWVPVHERDACLTADGLDLDYISNIKLMHYEGSPGVSRDLRQLPLTNRGYTAVVLLANWVRGRRTHFRAVAAAQDDPREQTVVAPAGVGGAEPL